MNFEFSVHTVHAFTCLQDTAIQNEILIELKLHVFLNWNDDHVDDTDDDESFVSEQKDRSLQLKTRM